MSRVCFAIGLLVGCGSSHTAPPASSRVGPALSAAFAAADRVREPWRCAVLDGPELDPVTLETGPRHWKLAGHTVTRTEDDPTTTIGVVADAGGSAPRTIAALTRLRAKLSHVDLVITLGGMGANQSELEATLGTLADHATWPVIALAGDLEAEAAQLAAIAALRKRGDAVIDARLARWIEVPGATIATIPGAGAAARLVAGGEGCGWRAETVAKLYAELTARPGMRIAALAEAPREIVRGDAVGEVSLVPSTPIDVVLHGPTSARPSAARAGTRDGHPALLSPGTSDATPRLPEPAAPSAGILVVRGASWTWEPVLDAERVQ